MGAVTEPLDPTTPSPTERQPRWHRLRRRAARLGSSETGRQLSDVVALARESLADPTRVLILVLALAAILRLVWLNQPGRSLIFDEAYYINAARVILGWQPTSHYVGSPFGLDPNTEHPPLGKLLIAGSMLLFGDNGIGWRIPSVIAGLIALVAVYGIVRKLHRSPWLGVLVVALVSLDNLTLVHGRIGTLDILVLAPMLVSAWLALDRRWVLAGVVMGIALLMKVTALYGLGAVVLYVVLTEGPAWWRTRRIPLADVLGPAAFVGMALVVALAGLTVLDARFTAFASPFDHIVRILTYGANLRAPLTPGHCPGSDSRPWQWLFNECQINYFRSDVTVRNGDTIVSSVTKVDFRGAMNPLLVAAIPLAGLFTGWYAWRRKSRLAIWAIAWTAANYLPYLALAIFTPRIEYIYYALPLVPAVAIGIALLLLRGGLPKPVQWGFLAAYVVGFLAYFPFRAVP